MWKKVFFAFVLIFISFSVSQASAIQTTGTFKIMNDKNESIAIQSVPFEEGAALMDITKSAFEIEEENGHIIAINGVRSIPAKNIHWVAFVNGDYIQIGPDEIHLYANDSVVWALRDLDNEEITK